MEITSVLRPLLIMMTLCCDKCNSWTHIKSDNLSFIDYQLTETRTLGRPGWVRHAITLTQSVDWGITLPLKNHPLLFCQAPS